MDKIFIELIKKKSSMNKEFIFHSGTDTSFAEKDDGLYLRYITPKKKEVWEYKLKELSELYEGDGVFSFESDEETEHYIPLMEAIESAIDLYYIGHPDLKDKNVISTLEQLILKTDVKPYSELLKAIQNNLRLCLSTNIYSKQEVKGGLKRILKSVKFHHQMDGAQGYVNFVGYRLEQEYFPRLPD